MADELTRKLPFSLIAEQSLLGSVLIDPQKISDIAGIINEDDFYLNDHTQIYMAMKQSDLTKRSVFITKKRRVSPPLNTSFRSSAFNKETVFFQ